MSVLIVGFLGVIIWTILAVLCRRNEIRVFITKHRKLVRAAIFVVVATVYLNVGWAIGTYYYTNIFSHEPQTFWQTVWKGGYGSISGGFAKESILSTQIFIMLTWPAVGLTVLLSWTVYAIHGLVVLAFRGIVFILWLIGAGGIAKLLGVG